MPLQRRVPKFGFNNINRKEYKAINLDAIEALAAAKNLEKVLANGALTRKVEVEADAVSKKAEEAIQAAGGSVIKK